MFVKWLKIELSKTIVISGKMGLMQSITRLRPLVVHLRSLRNERKFEVHKIVEWSDEDECYVGSSPVFLGQMSWRR